MILFISNNGESLPIAWRMAREGAQVAVYIHNPRSKHNYDGLIPKVSIAQLRKVARGADMVIFDLCRPNERTKYDIALLKMFGLKTGSPTVFGPLAEKLRKDHKVIGSSQWTEDLELDRYMGTQIASKIGIMVPETHDFKTLKDGIKFLKGRKDRWVFKPHKNQDLDLTYVEKWPGELAAKMEEDYETRLGTGKIEYMLQKFVSGYEISTEMWWNGKQCFLFNHTIEDKRLMNYNLGPAIGSQNNTVWLKKKADGLLVKEMKALAPYLSRAKYIGPVDVNCIIAHSGTPYFLEFTSRFGYDALFCLLSMVQGNIKSFFENGIKTHFHEGFASSARISIPPYPYSSKELLENFAKDVPIKGTLERMPLFWMEDVYLKEGKLKCTGSDGILGVIAARGNSLGGSVGNVYRTIDKLRVGAYLQYRTDLGRRAEKVLKAMEKMKVEVH